MLDESLRRTGFWTLDYLTGAKVRKHYLDIKSILENETGPAASLKKARYLQDILAYAAANVEFYKKFSGIDALDSFPVVDKNIIRNEYEAFLSQEYKGAKVFAMHTSGSTGTPFVVQQDKDKRNRVYAEMIHLWGTAGYQIGMRYAFFRVWTALNRRGKLSAWFRNVLMLDLQKQDEAWLKGIRRILRTDRKIRMLLIYPRSLAHLVNYLLAQGDTPEMFHLTTILGIGEAFPENLQAKVRQLFNCTVVSVYSNQENGVLAVECPQNKDFHVNSASYHIEILKFETDEPAGPGEPGRIVVTDLFNHAMPLIRYDTGDIGIWKKTDECGWHSQVMSSIQGKMRDFIFDTHGIRISPAAVNILMWPFDGLMQFQFIQEGPKQYRLKINEGEKRYEDAGFVDLFKGLVGRDADICVEHVNEIPVLSSGKRRTIINKWNSSGA